MKAANAISWMVVDAPDPPRARNVPPENSISPGGASSIADAMTLAFSITLSQAPRTATPPTASDREP